MNENNKKSRKEWVKTAAIVFLTVMLVLTFFSNTIMNYSLPEVAAQYVQSGTITAKIRGSGAVESSDPYEIRIKETRKVASVAVRQGDTVQKGDVLVYLEEGDSTEVEAAKETLEAAQEALEDSRKAFNEALLSANIDAEIIQEANSGVSTTTYRQQITAAQQELEKSKTLVKDKTQNEKAIQEQISAVELQISVTNSSGVDTQAEEKAYNEARKNFENKEAALTAKQNELDLIDIQIANKKLQIESEQTISSGDAGRLDTLQNELAQLQVNRNTVQQDYNTREGEYKAAKTALEKADAALTAKKDVTWIVENLTAQENNLKLQLNEATKARVAAENDLADKQAALDDLMDKIAQVLGISGNRDNIADAQKLVDKAQAALDKAWEQSGASTIVAEIAGTVTSINATAGREVSALDAVAVIQPEGKGYTMSFSVTNEQAKRLSVGDRADLVNAWYYNDIDVTLASIKPDPTNPGQNKKLTFDVTGDVIAGQTLNVSVGQKSANYDYIVPNSAIREDNNGKFILIVEAKSSPLNTRYIATRVDVEVLASDDTQSAINAALNGYEFVITTSTKPVEAGKQVRLSDNNS